MAQLPVVQVAVAFVRAQGTPQAPQLVRLVRGASQPLASVASQLPQPPLHMEMAQERVAHVALAWAREQATLHMPQSLSVLSAVSHPLPSMPSQLSHPGVHDVSVHVPVLQEDVPFAREQATPHMAQLLSVVSEVSQPLPSTPSQSPHPVSQTAMAQDTEAQVAVAWARAHGEPQAPQLEVVLNDASHPLPSIPSQSSHPPLHMAIAQVPVVHAAVAWARAQGTPHPAQLVVVVSGVSHPLASMPSQLE